MTRERQRTTIKGGRTAKSEAKPASKTSQWGNVCSINAADIASGHYVTWTQALNLIHNRLPLSTGEARLFISRLIYSRALPVWWEHFRQSNPDLPMRELRFDLPPRSPDYWQSANVDPSDPDRLREPVDDELPDGPGIPARRRALRYRKPLFHRQSLEQCISDFRKGFEAASDSDIRCALHSVNADADAQGVSKPNVLKAAKAAKALLEGKLLHATEYRLRRIAGEDEYRRMRKPGPTKRRK
jgi:hypothetical protein